jgi:hypothetical protein
MNGRGRYYLHVRHHISSRSGYIYKYAMAEGDVGEDLHTPQLAKFAVE